MDIRHLIRLAVLIPCAMIVQPANAAPKWLKTLAGHVALGAGVYTGTAYAANSQHPNWKAGITAAGAVALAKELTDLHDHREKPKSKTALDIGEIMAGAGIALAVKH